MYSASEIPGKPGTRRPKFSLLLFLALVLVLRLIGNSMLSGAAPRKTYVNRLHNRKLGNG